MPDNKVSLQREAKALVVLAFRNGPIENLHAGMVCDHCRNETGYSRISDAEMKTVMKAAVDQMYRLLCLRTNNPSAYKQELERGAAFARSWDAPKEHIIRDSAATLRLRNAVDELTDDGFVRLFRSLLSQDQYRYADEWLTRNATERIVATGVLFADIPLSRIREALRSAKTPSTSRGTTLPSDSQASEAEHDPEGSSESHAG